MSLGETSEQRAFRDGFNDGYEHGKNDQGDHFWEQNEALRAALVNRDRRIEELNAGLARATAGYVRMRAGIERFASMARAGTTTDEGVRVWHVPARDLNELIEALVDPTDVQSGAAKDE